jgi:hypothetical protein
MFLFGELGGNMDVLLSYEGLLADRHELDFYDAGRALSGFQRSLALTTHLVFNGEIITQAPALKNAKILLRTPRPGSWEVVATIVGGIWAAGTASKDSPIGHLLYSTYDYVIRQAFGFPVDYSKSLYQSYSDMLEEKKITPAKLDSLAEKVETSLVDMHRPIVISQTAGHADIFAGNLRNQKVRIGSELNAITYDHLSKNEIDDSETEHTGVVSSYNINTFSGRMFVFDEQRPIGFELEEGARTRSVVRLITSSLSSNAVERGTRDGAICMTGRKVTSSTGRLKRVIVSNVVKAED